MTSWSGLSNGTCANVALIERDSLSDHCAILSRTSVGAVLGTDLPANEVADGAALGGFPFREPFNPAALLGDGPLLAAELMRIAEPGEKLQRVVHAVDAEIKLRDMAKRQVKERALARGENFAGRERERRGALVGRVLCPCWRRGAPHRDQDENACGNTRPVTHRMANRKTPMNC